MQDGKPASRESLIIDIQGDRGPLNQNLEIFLTLNMKAGQVLEKNVFREGFYWPVHFS